MTDRIKIANQADMIINSYAFTKIPLGTQIVNLNCLSACVINDKCGIIEANMDDIELDIVSDYYTRNKKFLED